MATYNAWCDRTPITETGHPWEAVVGLRRGWRRRMVRGIRLLSAQRRLGLSDRHNGYQSHRTAPRFVPQLTARRLAVFLPDVVITQLEGSHEIAAVALRSGVSVVLMIRNAEFGRYT